MTPQVHLDGRERLVDADTVPAPTYAPSSPSAPSRPLSEADRQGLAMGWVSIGLGMFLLLGGLALWAAVALQAGFVGWLIGMAVIGLVIVAVLMAVTYTVIRPRR
jgi:hypothetical protein